jgi:hypothetical protein
MKLCYSVSNRGASFLPTSMQIADQIFLENPPSGFIMANLSVSFGGEKHLKNVCCHRSSIVGPVASLYYC